MAYEPKPGDGALFANEQRSKDTQPNATGYLVAHRDIKAGERIRLAAWTKSGTHGRFQSIRASDEREKQEQSYTDAAQPVNPATDNNPQAPLDGPKHYRSGDDPLDDDLPFIVPFDVPRKGIKA